MKFDVAEWFNWRYLLTLLTVFAACYLLIYLAAEQSYCNATMVQVESTYQGIVELRENITWLSIFVNNFMVSIYLLVPLAGMLYFFVALWNTGEIVGLLSVATGNTPFGYLTAITFPVALFEVFAYSILAAEIVYLLALLVTKNGFMDRLTAHSWRSFLLYVGVLLLIAYVEATLIG